MDAAPARKWISPENLLALVRNTTPFLPWIQTSPPTIPARLALLGDGPMGFWKILKAVPFVDWDTLPAESHVADYFALCLAAHHTTVATFVPTDVDSKIRGLLWRETRDPETLAQMLTLAKQSIGWDQNPVSRRIVRDVSGHNGEQLSVLAGAHGRFLDLGLTQLAEQSAQLIETELRREQRIFNETLAAKDAELDLLRLAMSMAHNRGDLNQGISFWRKAVVNDAARAHFTQLARFDLALRLYQETGMSAEGHRNYPLRSVKGLREDADLLLPLPPFLDDWGATVVQRSERAEIMDALIAGCRKLEGQQGYFRALAGMQDNHPKLFADAVAHLPNAPRRDLQSADFRKRLAVSRPSFESMMRKRARAVAGRS